MISSVGSNNMDRHKSSGVKRAKWHLGIRSQSKPHDIMNEVYRAMKSLDFVRNNNLMCKLQIILYLFICFILMLYFQEWKIVNPYHVRVRRRNGQPGKTAKMSLQLYQVDYKSYLLDFKSLSCEEQENSSSSKKQQQFCLKYCNYVIMLNYVIISFQALKCYPTPPTQVVDITPWSFLKCVPP